MKGLLSGLLLAASFSAPAQTNDLHAYLSETRRLQRTGENEQALERHLWFHKHALEHDPSMYGVRLSFAMGDWKRLAETYPPALRAMMKVRDEKTQRIIDGEGSYALFHDVASLNETLGENGKTLELFKTLEEKQPGMAMLCWNLVKDLAFDQKRMDLLTKYAADPTADFQDVKEDYQRLAALIEKKDIGGSQLKDYAENRFAQQTVQLINLATTLEKPDVAIAIQKEALGILDDPRIHAALSADRSSAQH